MPIARIRISHVRSKTDKGSDRKKYGRHLIQGLHNDIIHAYPPPSLLLQGWRTRAQLLVMYHGNTELVDRIIAAKTTSGSFRPHPDLPDDLTATLYLAPKLHT